MVLIHGNLDCEARWGNKPLPAAIRKRLALMSTMLRALVTDDHALLLALEPVEPQRVPALPALPQLNVLPASGRAASSAVQANKTRQADTGGQALAWAGTVGVTAAYDPGDVPWRLATIDQLASTHICAAVNDRRLTLTARQQAQVPLAGAAIIGSIEQLVAHVDTGGAALGNGAWICKAPWTAAGRDRVRGMGHDSVAVAAVAKLLRQCGGAVVFEPWLPRLFDLGVLAAVNHGRVTQRAPHRLLCNAHGGFAGISMTPPDLTTAERDLLHNTVETTGQLLASRGYRGPFTVDSFVHTAHGQRTIAPLCEINARLSFGWVALALTARLGGQTMMVGHAKDYPASATLVLLPTASDPFCAWLI